MSEPKSKLEQLQAIRAKKAEVADQKPTQATPTKATSPTPPKETAEEKAARERLETQMRLNFLNINLAGQQIQQKSRDMNKQMNAIRESANKDLGTNIQPSNYNIVADKVSGEGKAKEAKKPTWDVAGFMKDVTSGNYDVYSHERLHEYNEATKKYEEDTKQYREFTEDANELVAPKEETFWEKLSRLGAGIASPTTGAAFTTNIPSKKTEPHYTERLDQATKDYVATLEHNEDGKVIVDGLAMDEDDVVRALKPSVEGAAYPTLMRDINYRDDQAKRQGYASWNDLIDATYGARLAAIKENVMAEEVKGGGHNSFYTLFREEAAGSRAVRNLEDTIDAMKEGTFWSGFDEGFDTRSALTFGLTGLFSDIDLLRVQNKAKDGMPLTRQEQNILDLFAIKQDLEDVDRLTGITSARDIGQSVGYTTELMAQFPLAMNLAGSITKAIPMLATTSLKGSARWAVTRRAFQHGVMKGIAKGTTNLLGMGGTALLNLGKTQVVGGIASLVMPSTYANYVQARQKQFTIKDGKLTYTPTSAWSDFYNTIIDSSSEIASELAGQYIQNIADITFGKFGRMLGLNLIRPSAAWRKVTQDLSFSGMVGEPLSEIWGDITSNVLKMGITGDGNLSMLSDPEYWEKAFAVSMIYGGGMTLTSVPSRIMTYKQIQDLGKQKKELLAKVDEQDLYDALVMLSTDESVTQASQRLAKFFAMKRAKGEKITTDQLAVAMDYIRTEAVLQVAMGFNEQSEYMGEFSKAAEGLVSRVYCGEDGTTPHRAIVQVIDTTDGKTYDVASGNVKDVTTGDDLLMVRDAEGNKMTLAKGKNLKMTVKNLDALIAEEFENMFSMPSALDKIAKAEVAYEQLENPTREKVLEMMKGLSIEVPHEGQIIELADGRKVTFVEINERGEFIVEHKVNGSITSEMLVAPFTQIISSADHIAQAQRHIAAEGIINEAREEIIEEEVAETAPQVMPAEAISTEESVEVTPTEITAPQTGAKHKVGEIIDTPNGKARVVAIEGGNYVVDFNLANTSYDDEVMEHGEYSIEEIDGVTPTEVTTEATTPTEATPAETPQAIEEVQNEVAGIKAIPKNEDGTINYDAIDDPKLYADTFADEIGSREEAAQEVANMRDNVIADIEALEKKKKKSKSASETIANKKAIDSAKARVAFFDAVLNELAPAEVVEETTTPTEAVEEVAPAEAEDTERSESIMDPIERAAMEGESIPTTPKTTSTAPIATTTEAGLVKNELSGKLVGRLQKTIDGLAKAMGVSVEFVDEALFTTSGKGRVNAKIEGNKIIISWKDRARAIRFLIGHEFTHRMKKLSTEAYEAFEKSVINALGEKEWKKRVERMRKAYEAAKESISENDLYEEVVADYVGDMAYSDNYFDKWAEANKEKHWLLEWVSEMWQKLADWFKSFGDNGMAQRMRDMHTKLDALVASAEEAQAEAEFIAEREGTMPITSMSETKNSIIGEGGATALDMAEEGKGYSLSEETIKIFDAAKSKFGTTYDMREAGYILPDGSMLDFSGRHQVIGGDTSFLNGDRTVDHREISDIAYDADDNETGINTDLGDFLDRGAIRIDSNAGAINLNVAPTKAQKDRLKRLIERNEGYVYVDFGKGWNTEHYAEYEAARASRVLGDIDRYFDEGIKPTGNVRFSLQETNDRFNAELDAFKAGTHKGLLHLGYPSEILKVCGVGARELTISPRELSRHLKKHNLTTDDLKDLVYAIQEPIMVYKHGKKHPNIVVITEVMVNNGKLSVSIELDDKGNVVEISNISSVHSKDALTELERLSELSDEELKKALKWVDKEKVSGWLMPTPYMGSGASLDPKHLSTANIIQNFQNPKIEAKYSLITPEMDADYLSAVERGDMEKAQQMVMEAAKLAMPNTKVVDDDGNPKVMYHGTDHGLWTKLDTSRSGDGLSFFMTSDIRVARTYEKRSEYPPATWLPMHKDAGWQLDSGVWSRRIEDFVQDGYEISEEQIKDYYDGKDVIIRRPPEKAVDTHKIFKFFVNAEHPLIVENETAKDWRDLTVAGERMTTKGVSAYAKDNGYDAAYIKNIYDMGPSGGWDDYYAADDLIIYHPNQIKSADPVTYDDNGNVIPLSERFNPEKEDIRYSIQAPTFYSNAEYAVLNIKQEKATPEQWLKMIEKAGGLKAGEDKWLGLSGWLKASDKKTLTKDEVLQYIADNNFVIEEVEYADVADISREEIYESAEYKALVERLTEYDDDGNAHFNLERYLDSRDESEDFVDGFYTEGKELKIDSPAAAATYLGLTKADKDIHGTRLGYTTAGLENKREIALVVPSIEPYNRHDEIHFGDAGEGRAVAWIRFGETTIQEPHYYSPEVTSWHEPYKNARNNDVYKPMGGAGKNAYVVHRDGMFVLLVNDRPISTHDTLDEAGAALNEYHKQNPIKLNRNKQVLVIDEIQSKRHQDGREKGYSDKRVTQQELYDAQEAAFEAVMEQERALADKYGEDEWASLATAEEMAEYERLRAIDEAATNAYENYDKGVPSAPFEKNWAELAMKRMLRYAAENGFDKVAWTTGEQQADRYNLGKIYDYIEREDNPNIKGKRFVLAGGNYDNFVVDDNAIVVSSSISEANGKSLTDVVGKDMAEKMMSLEDGDTISGDGLRIGGEGMKGFYDQMLPSFMNKYGKKWGVKVGEVTMPNLEENNTMHSVDVTDAMRESVMQGQPRYSLSYRPTGLLNDFAEEFEALQKEYESLDPTTLHAHHPFRVRKRKVVQKYLNYVSEVLGLPCEAFVLDSSNEQQVRTAYRKYIASRQANGKRGVASYEEFKEEISDAIGEYFFGTDMAIINIGIADSVNINSEYLAAALHENGHKIIEGMNIGNKMLEAIYEEAQRLAPKQVERVDQRYGDESIAGRGEEIITFALQTRASFSKTKELLMQYFEGKVSEDDILKSFNNPLPLRDKILKDTLIALRDGYNNKNNEHTNNGGDNNLNGEAKEGTIGNGLGGEHLRSAARGVLLTTPQYSLNTDMPFFEDNGDIVIFDDIIEDSGREHTPRITEETLRTYIDGRHYATTQRIRKEANDMKSVARLRLLEEQRRRKEGIASQRTNVGKIDYILGDTPREALSYYDQALVMIAEGGVSVRWEDDSNGRRGLASELGLSKAERRNYKGVTQGATQSVDAFVHSWWESLGGYENGIDTQDLRNALLEALMEAPNAGAAIRTLRDKYDNVQREYDDTIADIDANTDRELAMEDARYNEEVAEFEGGADKSKLIRYYEQSVAMHDDLSAVGYTIRELGKKLERATREATLAKARNRNDGTSNVANIRALRQSIAEAKEAVKQAMNDSKVLKYNSREVQSIINSIDEAKSAEAVKVVLGRVENILLNIRIREERNNMQRLLNMRLPNGQLVETWVGTQIREGRMNPAYAKRIIVNMWKGVNSKGVTVANYVDEHTAAVMTFLRDNLVLPIAKRGVVEPKNDDGTKSKSYTTEREAKENTDILRAANNDARNTICKTASKNGRPLTKQEQIEVDARELYDRYLNVVEVKRQLAENQEAIIALKEQKRAVDAEMLEATHSGMPFEELNEMRNSLRKQLSATYDARREIKRNYEKHLIEFNEHVGAVLAMGRDALKAFREGKELHRQEVVITANEAIGGKRPRTSTDGPTVMEKVAAHLRGGIHDTYWTFETSCREIDRNAPNGEGKFFKMMMGGATEAADSFASRQYAHYTRLGDKIHALWGMKRKSPYEAFVEIMRKADTRKVGSLTYYTQMSADGQPFAPETTEMRVSNAMFTIAMWRQAQYKATMARYGITQEMIDNLILGIEKVDPRYIEFMNFINDEFLPDTRLEYDEVHKKMFGASMDNIENYFPARVIRQHTEVDIANNNEGALPSTVTRSVISRKAHGNQPDYKQSYFGMLLSHIQDMDHWASYAPLTEDVNAVLSNVEFRNRLNEYKSGVNNDRTGKGSLYQIFRTCCAITLGTYTAPKPSGLNELLSYLTRGWPSANIAWRFSTAIKQLSAAPIFAAYVLDPRCAAMWAKNCAVGIIPMQGLFEWATENSPSFRVRWASRAAGSEKLDKSIREIATGIEYRTRVSNAKDAAWNFLNKIAVEWGMTPNAAVDAWACATGMKTIYEYEIFKATKGKREATEAEKKEAMRKAEIFMNTTQQSAESAYLSESQMQKDFLTVNTTTYMNASYAYHRLRVGGIQELWKGLTNKEYREAIKAYYGDEALTEANKKALARLLQGILGDINFYLMTGLMTSAYALIAGIDDDEDEDKTSDMTTWDKIINIFRIPLSLSLSGLLGGNLVMSSLEGFDVTLTPRADDLIKDVKKISPKLDALLSNKKNIEEAQAFDTWAAISFLSRYRYGVDAKTFLNIAEGIAEIDSVEGIMKIMNEPRSSINLIAGRRRKGETLQENVERRIHLEIIGNEPSFSDMFSYDKEKLNYIGQGKVAKIWGLSDKQIKDFVKDYKARQARAVFTPEERKRNEAIDKEYAEVCASMGWKTTAQPSDDAVDKTSQVYKYPQGLSYRQYTILKEMGTEIRKDNIYQENFVGTDEAYGKKEREIYEKKQKLINEYNEFK